MKMMFSDVVLKLRVDHPELWFCTGTRNPAVDVVQPSRWTWAAIVSSDGHRLASMAGGANKWEFAYGYQSHGLSSVKGNLLYCVELTELDYLQAIAKM
ncbi:TPA: hypothetical protein MAK55_000152 [Klebsiella pneumoniae]|uniref:hypothetical protein n=2 Tax=Klebsiella pneumoniae TaxID=573 RepID=UPI000C7AD3B9|nr:hypothetical protein [Klebsiella pneumoniae]HBQ5974256.1 hypothetical protein [Klebsiella pneumoniae subsp. pneumoniae]EIV9613850.1 hypothetical protein [Klebsiella pneumoniae]EIW8625756.1 hypothetical protein [Klebsiella pneumoniae]EKZ9736835.1 hypothetical protein [Klebsiella pneumoniae]MBD7742968.1 hypothetical protein [Klebsiella pneumoniae]